MNVHYTNTDLQAALERLPLNRGDVLFIHSNIGFFGRAEGINRGDELCQLFFDALMNRLGEDGTLVVPTFTYSFPRRKMFDLKESISDMGLFAEWLRKHPNAYRSCDPSYSVAAIGSYAQALTSRIPENSFSPDGFFGRFLDANGIVLNLNFDAGSTFLHYLERQIGVPYRFDKTFEGLIYDGNNARRARNTIYVRYLSSDATAPDFKPFHTLASERGQFVGISLGRGQIGCIRAKDCSDLLNIYLPKRPWMLTRAEELGVIPQLIPEPIYQAF